MHRPTGLLILMLCVVVSGSLDAANEKPAAQPTMTPMTPMTPMGEQGSNSSAPASSGASVSTTVSTAPESTPAEAPLTIVQIRQNLPVLPADRFEFLRRQRKVTLEAINAASSQLQALTASINLLQKQLDTFSAQKDAEVPSTPKEKVESDRKHASDELTQVTAALSAARAKPGVAEAEIKRLESAVETKQQYLDSIESYVARMTMEEKRSLDKAIVAKLSAEELSHLSTSRDRITQLQLYYQRLLGEIDDMVNQLFISSDATNSFKLKMSIAFAALVAVVIAGFFLIAFSNDEVKKAIFSNEAGIQFITMFSIVIAVILFGIIGILESKELSALLGGLSGYILGKSKG